MKELADCEIDTLTISQIQDAIDRNASTYYTRKDMKTVLSHCYNLAIAEKQTTVNLAEYIKLPELDENRRSRLPTPTSKTMGSVCKRSFCRFYPYDDLYRHDAW